MQRSALLAASCAFAALIPIHVQAQEQKPATITTISFPLKVSAGAASCLPNAKGSVVDHTTGPSENLTVSVSGLPPNTDFDLFIIQSPVPPFGLVWYQGDIETDSGGNGSGTFVGRFNVETFIVSLGALKSVNQFPSPPAVLPQSTTGAAVNPVQIYHLGLWFNSAADATEAGCPGTPTTFNGVHNAGIQVLNTAQFTGKGPLAKLH